MAMTNTPCHGGSAAAQAVDRVNPVKTRTKKCRTNQRWERQRAQAGGGWQMAAGKEPVDDQSHNSRQQATKVCGNHGADRAHNNQPLMGAAKAGGGWQ